ncbi:hypothetical protein NDA18_000044 [Ustilago nuda]|nr:hypothetical protein NDA18_000044 [Ustilago nuda]
MMDVTTIEPQRYIPMFGLSGLGFQLQGNIGQQRTTSEVLDLDNGPSRYVAYAMRLKTIIIASSRYVAYSSDIGEAFRPLTKPGFVRGAYAVSWTYILGDSEAAKSAEKALSSARENLPLEKLLDAKTLGALSPTEKVELRKRHTQRLAAQGGHAGVEPNKVSEPMHVGLVMARRAVFQSIASMALPAFTIHSIVRYSAPLFAKAKSTRIRAAGPTVAGLLFVPALPFLFDEPVEHVIDFAFDWIQERLIGGSKAADRVFEAAKEKVL